MSKIGYWLRDLVQWLRTAIGLKQSKAFEVIEHYVSLDTECEAWLLADEMSDCGLAGMVVFWLIRHHTNAESDLLLMCFNTAQIREAYQGTYNDDQTWRRRFEISARLHLKLQADILSTHLFMAGWVDKKAKTIRFVDSEMDCYKLIRCTSFYAVDLQGHAAAWMGSNGSATRIMRDIVLRCIRIAPSNLSSWDSLLQILSQTDSKTTWLTWLQTYSCREIDKDHVLQPKKLRSKPKKARTPTHDRPHLKPKSNP